MTENSNQTKFKSAVTRDRAASSMALNIAFNGACSYHGEKCISERDITAM